MQILITMSCWSGSEFLVSKVHKYGTALRLINTLLFLGLRVILRLGSTSRYSLPTSQDGPYSATIWSCAHCGQLSLVHFSPPHTLLYLTILLYNFVRTLFKIIFHKIWLILVLPKILLWRLTLHHCTSPRSLHGPLWGPAGTGSHHHLKSIHQQR